MDLQAPSLPRLEFDPNSLPLGQLESLRFKINQIIDSVQNLQRTIEFGVQTSGGFIPNALPPWPDILAKYNLLVSQTHTLSTSLAAAFAQAAPSNPTLGLPGRPKPQPSNPFEKLALHPSVNMTEAQFDNDLIPLLRSQQTVSVLNEENVLVARIQEAIKELNSGMNGISRLVQSSSSGSNLNQIDHERTIQACETIRSAHDVRIDRARRAVTMLRDKYDWKLRLDFIEPVAPPPVPEQSVPPEGETITPTNDNDEVESALMGNGSSDANDMEDDQEGDDEEKEEPLAAIFTNPEPNPDPVADVTIQEDMIDLTGSPAQTPGSAMAIDEALNAAFEEAEVIDMTNSAAATPAQASEGTDSDVALAGIFTPNMDDSKSLPPA